MTDRLLYVDGDSYTTPNYCVDVQDSYWKLFGDYLNIDNIVNYAYSGKSNDGIFRNATRFILDNPDKELFILLGFTHLERYDVFNRERELAVNAGDSVVNPNPNPCEIGVETRSYKQESKESDVLIYWHREFDESKFLSSLINFNAFCEKHNVKFILHFCSHPLVNPEIDLLNTFYKEIDNLPNIVNLFENTYTSYNQTLNIKPADFKEFGWVGHHGSEGNKAYAEFLINKYRELYEQ